MPSKVSASPSSWKAPVRSAVAAVAIRTAMRVGKSEVGDEEGARCDGADDGSD